MATVLVLPIIGLIVAPPVTLSQAAPAMVAARTFSAGLLDGSAAGAAGSVMALADANTPFEQQPVDFGSLLLAFGPFILAALVFPFFQKMWKLFSKGF